MMKIQNGKEQGFTLIATLLLLLLLTGVGLGLMMMTTTETRVGGNDMENSLAYHAAEAGMEKMTVDLATLFSNSQSPSANAISTSSLAPTTIPNVTYDQYSLTVQTDTAGKPITRVDNISQGPNAGLIALIEPITLQVGASRPGGMSVNMIRTVEVALIPVFQFGVFSDSDLSYFPGPTFDFKGRVHTNGNLFLATQSAGGLIFHSKVSAVGEVVRDYLANGFPDVTVYNGPVYIPNAPNGCDGGQPATNCLNLSNQTSPPQGSVYGGVPLNGAIQNPAWVNLSTTTFAYYIINGLTGARQLKLPFVGGAAGPIELIRKPAPNESPTSAVGQSRSYNKAQIRILMADTQALLHPDRPGTDADDVQLVNAGTSTVTTAGAVNWTNGANTTGPINVTGVGNTWFAEANQDCGAVTPNKWCEPYDQYKPGYVTGTSWNLLAADQTAATKGAWLRVEYLDNAGNWNGVTRQWLAYGFARNPVPPQAIGANTVNPNAILLLQQQADRDGLNGITVQGTALTNTYAAPYNYNTEREAGATVTGATEEAAFLWFPINMYDPREGEIRDVNTMAAGTCAPNGIMNVVEIDVGNLRRWLGGGAPYNAGNGPNVNFTNQNGYLLYFSDRRGMQPDPNPAAGSIYPANVLVGEYGFEDTINSGTLAGTPDSALEPNNPGTTQSPEDVDGKGSTLPIDTWGVVTVMDGYVGMNGGGSPMVVANARNVYGDVRAAAAINFTRLNPRDPYTNRVNCMQVARKNLVSGARHVLRLVDGALGNLPTAPGNVGGFTVASENPVYVLGNYNATAAGWGANNAAAGILADSVTLLSFQWSDLNGFVNPFTVTNRNAGTTYYRTAIAAGKTYNFPRPSANYSQDFGTDGGTHNFLRYIEDWSGQTLNYQGSLVSLFYSQYATGVFKCCTTVYNPPTRGYSFDTLFLDPTKLPPGTPMFEDINNLSYRQDFTSR